MFRAIKENSESITTQPSQRREQVLDEIKGMADSAFLPETASKDKPVEFLTANTRNRVTKTTSRVQMAIIRDPEHPKDMEVVMIHEEHPLYMLGNGFEIQIIIKFSSDGRRKIVKATKTPVDGSGRHYNNDAIHYGSDNAETDLFIDLNLRAAMRKLSKRKQE